MINEKKPSIVVMGDVNLDYIVRKNLPFNYADLVENGILHFQEIEERPGGSALNFCYYAKNKFRPFLLGKVGEDAAGKVITNWLNNNGIEYQQNWVSPLPTGKAIICRDASDIRLLVNNIDNANHALSVEDVEANKQIITNTTILYISGYCINAKNKPRIRATRRVIDLANSTTIHGKPFIVFDVVPHRIYETLSFSRFLKLTEGVDLIISEVPTMRRFLKLGSKEEKIDSDMALITLESMKNFFNHIILRFGPSGCDQQLVFNHETNVLFHNRDTKHDEAHDKRGFGDKLTISALNDFYLSSRKSI